MDIEADLLENLRERSAQSGIAFKELLNTVLRDGLARPRPRQKPYICPTFNLGIRLPHKMIAALDAMMDEEGKDSR